MRKEAEPQLIRFDLFFFSVCAGTAGARSEERRKQRWGWGSEKATALSTCLPGDPRGNLLPGAKTCCQELKAAARSCLLPSWVCGLGTPSPWGCARGRPQPGLPRERAAESRAGGLGSPGGCCGSSPGGAAGLWCWLSPGAASSGSPRESQQAAGCRCEAFNSALV